MPSLVARLSEKKYSRREVAELCGMSEAAVDRWSRVGVNGHRLRRVKVGGKTYILAADLDRFLAACGSETDPPAAAVDADADAEAAEAELAALGVACRAA